MTDWYFHDPAQGRTGPLDAAQLRERYRQRRITRDTLVWHGGMREWQPLDKVSDVVGIDDVVPDTSLPPPLPAVLPRSAMAASRASTAPHARAPMPEPRRMSGCAIAAIVLGVGGLFGVGILAAIALPAYNDYVKRARTAQGPAAFDADAMAAADATTRELIAGAMRVHPAGEGLCPDTFQFERLQLREPRLQGSQDGWSVLSLSAESAEACTYDAAFHGLGSGSEGRTARYTARRVHGAVSIDCRNLNLPAGHLPPACRP